MTTRTCDPKILAKALEYIANHKVSPQSLPFSQINKFIASKEEMELPDITIDELDELQGAIYNEYFANQKGKKATKVEEIYNNILELMALLPKYPSSEFEITISTADGDYTYTRQRMENKKFRSIYNCLTSTSNKDTITFIKEIDEIVQNKLEPIDLSLDQVAMFISTYTSESRGKKVFQAYYDYISTPQEATYSDVNEILNKSEQSVDEINYVFEHTEFDLEKFEIATMLPELHQKYLSILEQCKNLSQRCYGLLPAASTAIRDYVPIVIFKSWQIYNYFRDHKDFKIIKCVLFNHFVPICCVSSIMPEPLIIQNMTDDMHLKLKSKMIHRCVLGSTTILRGDIVHHINSNEFDNRVENLITMYANSPVQSKKQEAVVSSNATRKHTNLHLIMQSNHQQMFYDNCYDLRKFEESNSFYKKLIKDLNNVQQFKYEYLSSYYTKPEQDLFKLYNFVKDAPLYYRNKAESIFEK